MTEKKYRIHDWVKFQYSEIGEYIDENHTDRPLRNDEIVDLLNEQHEEKEYLKTRFHEERELAMRLSKECDTLTIKKQELELEIIRLETIIRTGDVE